MKILIVDDKAENRYLLETFLSASGYEIVSAANGAEALTVALNGPPDMIIADILMPVMDGFALCRECKMNERLKNIPFVFYTATYTDQKDEEFALSLGADRFIAKPQEMNNFLLLIKETFAACKAKVLKPSPALEPEEKIFLREYNETLVRKLEDKMVQVEAAQKELWIKNAALENELEERKRVEAALIIAKEKAEESDRLKSAFLHNISHEIRTPMNAIIGFSELLSNLQSSPEKRKSYTDIIIKSTHQLLSIITDIISISMIEAGQEKMIKKEISVNSICKLAHEQFQTNAASRNIALRYKTALRNNEATIISDEAKLTEILVNLIGNALKFTKQGHVEFGYTVKDRELEFYVEDTGLGILPEMHDEIFKRFRQVETDVTNQLGGSGLGLSISKAFVELLGGKIWLTSEPSRGSVFYFTIPFIKANSPGLTDKHFAKELAIDGKIPKTLLVAEDEDFNYMLLEEYLSYAHLKIIRAINGIEAVEICRSNQPIDLVLMDLKMPGMDGYTATKIIKELRPNLTVIAQTAYSYESDKAKAMESGCSDLISKPFKKEQLLTLINSYLDN